MDSSLALMFVTFLMRYFLSWLPLLFSMWLIKRAIYD